MADGERCAQRRRAWHIFTPLLAGATLSDRLLMSVGALVGISLTGALCGLLLGAGPDLILLVPPMGASAVLVFAVPASPLAQPWPTIGGNVLSAAVGILTAHFISDPALAAGCAVGGAIALMSVCRCIHPPGGAAALVAVFGGPTVKAAGFLFPLAPVGLNAILLVGSAWLFHRFSGHSYPHVALATPPKPAQEGSRSAASVTASDVHQALREIGETFDISEADIERLVCEVEAQVSLRRAEEA